MAYFTTAIASAAGTGIDLTRYISASWPADAINTYPLNFNYNDTPEVPVEIGGNTCHLCGAEKDAEYTNSQRKKSGQWKTSKTTVYACDSSVYTDPKGKKHVTVGKDCIKVAD
jgi:hypothetical protein